MLTNRTLQRINNRPRNVNRLPLLAAGGGALVLATLLYAFAILPPFADLAVAGGGALLTLLLYVTQKAKTTVSLSYKDNLDEETASRFSQVREALEGLASSESIWSLPASSKRPKAGDEVAPIPEREKAKLGLLPTPGIKADVPVWGIDAGDGTLFFFPEGTLLYRNDRYEPVSYSALKMGLSSGRYFEEDLPDDATVVETVWRYSRPDGTPDPRRKNDNAEIPVVLYNLLDIKGPSGLDWRLLVSKRKAAAHFARVFRAKDLRETKRARTTAGKATSKERNGHEERPKSAVELEREARLAAARKTLGVEKNATPEQIGAAYRELARTHHPDKVSHLESEAREYSEERMKEINIAYAELRGHGGSVARGARTV